MSITIRKAAPEDIAVLLELLYELERPQPIDDSEVKIFEEKIRDYFLDEQKLILVAEEDKVVGLVSIIFLQRLNRAKKEMYIPEMVVTESKRSLGIGRQLMNYCMNLAKKNNCYRIRLESGNMRRKSHIFYRELGFEQSSLSFTKML